MRKLSSNRKLIEGKRTRLIQSYLDAKFLGKCAMDSLKISDLEVFTKVLTSEIKEYYNLEDVVVVDSIKNFEAQRSTLLRKQAINCVEQNIKRIKGELAEVTELFRESITCNSRKYIIYASCITPTDKESDKVIVCIGSRPLVGQNELLNLENVINILRIRIAYQGTILDTRLSHSKMHASYGCAN